MNYDLEERTTRFGEKIIDFIRDLKLDDIGRVLSKQLLRSATSIGANYREANEASSKKDFRNKIFISKKETSETNHWIRLIAKAIPEKENETKRLQGECNELLLIFGKIIHTLDNKAKH